MPFTDRPQTPMTKQEFLEGVRDMVQDMADPAGDFQTMAREGEEIIAEIRNFDPVMATKFQAILTSISDFGDYVSSRAEFLGEQAAVPRTQGDGEDNG